MFRFLTPLIVLACLTADASAGPIRRLVCAEVRVAERVVTAPFHLLHRERSAFRQVTRTRTVAVGGCAGGACALPTAPKVMPAPKPEPKKK